MSTALAESTGVTNIGVLIQAAIDKGMPAESLEKLFELSERWERNRAAEAFADSITAFQAEMPQIHKAREAKGRDDSKLSFSYASLDDIMKIAGPILAKNRIVVTFDTDSSVATQMKATCRIRVGTHSESTSVMLPIPPGKVTATQLFGQAISYAKRYALCAALNIIVTDEDNDGRGGQPEQLGDGQTEILNNLIDDVRQLAPNEETFGKWLKFFYGWIGERQKTAVESLNDVHENQFGEIVRYLDEKKKKSAKGGK